MRPLLLSRYGFLLLVCACLACSQTREKSAQDTPLNMVHIPAASFEMGARSTEAYADEYPKHPVEVSGFYMDATEVTNAEFKKFVEATGYITSAERDIDWEELKKQAPPHTPKPPDSLLAAGSMLFKATQGPVDLNQYLLWWEWKAGANWKHPEGPGSNIKDRWAHPVVHVSHEDALAYCRWSGKRLPTEAEWEWAASGGRSKNKYPWGNTDIKNSYDKANFWQGMFPWKNEEKDGYAGTAPVKSYAPNAFGLYDMAGNVWEWCSDRYSTNTYAEDLPKGKVSNPKGPGISFDPNNPYSKELHVVRGGSYLCNDTYCSGYRVSRRLGADREVGASHTGFRCVRDE